MRLKDWKYPKIEDGKPTRWSWLVQNVKGLKLGFGTDIGSFCYINAKHGVVIGDYVQLGSHCSIYSLSTIDGKKGKVVLKRNCRIGTHSVVMPGVTVGENSIVGAFSFVTEDVPDDSIAYGVPAKFIRRLTKKELKSMLREV